VTSGAPLYALQGIFDSNPLGLVAHPLWHTDFRNFAPRIGAAYQITPKSVVRGGFGLFYDLGYGNVGSAVIGDWAVDGLVRVMTAPPINVFTQLLSPELGRYKTQVDVVPGQSVWIPDSTQPSGRALNPATFTFPPAGQPGDSPRNGLRSPYSIDQTDLALRRRFSLTERVQLDVRAEYFNVLNHPMFGIPGSQCAPFTLWAPVNANMPHAFGRVCPSTSTTNIDGGGPPNGQSTLYAVGGPRSAQFTLKLSF
jgi:hypothetical protein